jgi:hypothetical protein
MEQMPDASLTAGIAVGVHRNIARGFSVVIHLLMWRLPADNEQGKAGSTAKTLHALAGSGALKMPLAAPRSGFPGLKLPRTLVVQVPETVLRRE